MKSRCAQTGAPEIRESHENERVANKVADYSLNLISDANNIDFAHPVARRLRVFVVLQFCSSSVAAVFVEAYVHSFILYRGGHGFL